MADKHSHKCGPECTHDHSADEQIKQMLGQKYMELQLVDRQIKQSQSQSQALESQVMEIDAIDIALDDLSKVPVGTEILVPFASGIFAKAELKDSNNLIVSVGGGATVSKPVADVKVMLREQVSEVRKMQQELSKEIQMLANQAQKIEKEITDALTGKAK